MYSSATATPPVPSSSPPSPSPSLFLSIRLFVVGGAPVPPRNGLSTPGQVNSITRVCVYVPGCNEDGRRIRSRTQPAYNLRIDIVKSNSNLGSKSGIPKWAPTDDGQKEMNSVQTVHRL